MKSVSLFVSFCIIAMLNFLNVECSTANGATLGHTQNSDDKLDDLSLPITKKDSTSSIQDHFSTKLVSIIRETTTNLLSPTNTQTLSFLLTLLPAFPPAAILGSVVMVILSALQSPSMLLLLQQIFDNVTALLQSPGSISFPNSFFDVDNMDIDKFYGLNDAVEYGTQLSNHVFKSMQKDKILQSDKSNQSSGMNDKKDRIQEFLNRKRVNENQNNVNGGE